MLKMDPIRLARLEEHRQAVGTADLCNESEPVGGGIMSYQSPNSWANQACGLGLDGPVSGGELDRLVAFYRERQAKPRIEVAAHCDESLIAGLAERGFQTIEFENIYAAEWAQGEDVFARLPWGIPNGVRCELIDRSDDTHWRAFIDVATSGFAPRLQKNGAVLPLDDETQEFMSRMIRHERTTCIAAWADGAMVGAAAMEIAGELCCLFGGCVLSAFRGRGIQAMMIAERFAIGQRAGCEIAVTHTKPGIATERNCRRLGCELAYTKVVMEAPLSDKG